MLIDPLYRLHIPVVDICSTVLQENDEDTDDSDDEFDPLKSEPYSLEAKPILQDPCNVVY